MDYRLPQHRRALFLKFYDFHLKYRAHPGGVYYVLPALRTRFSLSSEDMLTLCYINGLTQNIVTTWMIFSRFPTLKEMTGPAFAAWFRESYSLLLWDSDRKWEKNKTEKHLENYQELLGPLSQVDYFSQYTDGNPHYNFEKLWVTVTRCFTGFGRLATFSYLEYLRIVGLPIDCPTLFLSDIEGSRSHRNGLLLLLGRDDLIYDKTLNPGVTPRYSKADIVWLEREAQVLLDQAVKHPDRGNFTLESTLCCYKSWHKPNRRYPNVYNDMLHYRIKYAEERWPKENLEVFWKIRREVLPDYLCLEANPRDPGLAKEKQNHYRLTGQPIMMDRDYPELDNDFNRRYYGDP